MIQYSLLFILIAIVGIFAGAILTESRFSISNLSLRLNRKPFNCKPCLTFHILWILYGIAALALQSINFFYIGLAASFAIFGVLYLDNKHKTIK